MGHQKEEEMKLNEWQGRQMRFTQREFLKFTSCGLKGQNPFNRANQRLEILTGSITVQFID